MPEVFFYGAKSLMLDHEAAQNSRSGRHAGNVLFDHCAVKTILTSFNQLEVHFASIYMGDEVTEVKCDHQRDDPTALWVSDTMWLYMMPPLIFTALCS